MLSRLQESPRSSSCLRDITIQRQRADAPSYAMTAAAWRKCCAATTPASGAEVRAGTRSHCSMWQARKTALFPRQAKRSLGAAHLYNIVWAAMGVGVPSGRATDWTISSNRGCDWRSPLPSKWFDQPKPPPDFGTSHAGWEWSMRRAHAGLRIQSAVRTVTFRRSAQRRSRGKSTSPVHAVTSEWRKFNHGQTTRWICDTWCTAPSGGSK